MRGFDREASAIHVKYAWPFLVFATADRFRDLSLEKFDIIEGDGADAGPDIAFAVFQAGIIGDGFRSRDGSGRRLWPQRTVRCACIRVLDIREHNQVTLSDRESFFWMDEWIEMKSLFESLDVFYRMNHCAT